MSKEKSKQEKLLDHVHHSTDNPNSPQRLTDWANKFTDACDDKDVQAGVLSPENRRQPQ